MVQEIQEHVEEVHYSAVHTALEQYFDREIPGSLTYAHYPEADLDGGEVRFVFTAPSEADSESDSFDATEDQK